MASELTLRIMKRIVDKKLGPDANPKQAVRTASMSSSSQGMHLSTTEESTLKQLINPAKSVQMSSTKSTSKSNVRTTQKSKSIEEFAASYNKGKSAPAKKVQKSTIANTQRMNLNDLIQTKKK